MGKNAVQISKRNEEIVAAIKSGQKTTVVALKFGIDASQVSRIWRLNGGNPIRKGRPRKYNYEKVISLYDANTPLAEIAKQIGYEGKNGTAANFVLGIIRAQGRQPDRQNKVEK
jgi:transposase-like protein